MSQNRHSATEQQSNQTSVVSQQGRPAMNYLKYFQSPPLPPSNPQPPCFHFICLLLSLHFSPALSVSFSLSAINCTPFNTTDRGLFAPIYVFAPIIPWQQCAAKHFGVVLMVTSLRSPSCRSALYFSSF